MDRYYKKNREGRRSAGLGLNRRFGLTHGKFRKEKKSGQGRRNATCYHCTKKGRMKRECRQEKEDEKMFKTEQGCRGLYLLGTRNKNEPLIKLKAGRQREEVELKSLC